MAQLGNTLQTRLDLPLWYKADLDASGKVPFYTVPGLTNISSIDQARTVDKTAQYQIDGIHIAVMKKLGSATMAIDAATVELIARMQAYTWFNFLKNGREYVWSGPAALLLAAPVEFDPAVAAYDISKSVNGIYMLQEPVIIPGGQALNITQEWEQRPMDLTGLTVQFTMLGPIDREIARG